MYQLNKCCTLLLLAEAFSNEISLHGRSGHWHIWITKFSIYHMHVPKSTGESYKTWSCAQSTDMWWSILFAISVAYTAICLSARVTQVQQATSAGTWKHGVAYKLLRLSLNDSISKKWQNLNENGFPQSIFLGEKSSEFWKWTRLNLFIWKYTHLIRLKLWLQLRKARCPPSNWHLVICLICPNYWCLREIFSACMTDEWKPESESQSRLYKRSQLALCSRDSAMTSEPPIFLLQ